MGLIRSQHSALTPQGLQPSKIDFENVSITPLPIDKIGRRMGLGSSQIHQSVVSKDRRIWSASPVGLVCYDGVNIRVFGRKNGLHCHGLRTLALGEDNTLWLGSDAGVEIVDISGTVPISSKFSQVGIVDSISVSSEGGVIGTPNGLYFLNENGHYRPSVNPFLSKVRITSAYVDTAENIWVTGPKIGLAVYRESTWQFIDPKAYQDIGTPDCLALGPEGHVLVGGDHGFAIITVNGQTTHSMMTDKPVSALHWSDDLIWLGIGTDLVTLEIKNNEFVLKDRIFKDTLIRDIISDEFKNIWISTDNTGILRVSGMRHIFKAHQKTQLGAVFCIKDGSGGKLIGGAKGLLLPDQKTVLKGKAVWDAHQDSAGTVWAATQQGFFQIPVSRSGERTERAYVHKLEALAAPCRAIETYNTHLYIGSTKGLVRIGANGPKEVLRPNGKSLGYVYSLHIGPAGDLWVATLGAGLWRIKNDQIINVSGGPVNEKSNVYALTHSPSGTLYVCHDGYVSKIGREGVPILFVNSRNTVAGWSAQTLGDDKLALGTSDGFVIYDCKTHEVLRRVSNNTDTSNWEFTCSRSLFVDENDTIYCGVSSGLKTMKLASLMDMTVKPSADLARIQWLQVEPEKRGGQYVLKSGKWRFEVELQSCWYLDEVNCKMRYRLTGFDKEWSTLQPIGKITYTSLPPGTYNLEVCLYSPLTGTGPSKTLMSIRVKR